MIFNSRFISILKNKKLISFLKYFFSKKLIELDFNEFRHNFQLLKSALMRFNAGEERRVIKDIFDDCEAFNRIYSIYYSCSDHSGRSKFTTILLRL